MTIAFPFEESNATTAPTNRISEIADPEAQTSEISNLEISNPPPRKLPLSPKRLTANRANAKKSTGPRTRQGKQTVSKNATTHALTATPDPTLFQDLNYSSRLYELTKEFRPTSPTQTYLVEQLALIGHKLDQIPQIESHLLAQAAASDSSFILQYSSLSSLIAHELLKDKPTPLTRLYDLQRRLQSRFQSIIRQIHQQQKHHAKQRAEDFNQESESDRQKREDQDHKALNEELTRIHEHNKQRDQQARTQRNKELPAQNKPTYLSSSSSFSAPSESLRSLTPQSQRSLIPAQTKPTAPPVTATPSGASNPPSIKTQIGDNK